MGENSTTLGDQVGSPRVVPILRLRTRFFHTRRIFVLYWRFRSFAHHVRAWSLQAQRIEILRQYRET